MLLLLQLQLELLLPELRLKLPDPELVLLELSGVGWAHLQLLARVQLVDVLVRIRERWLAHQIVRGQAHVHRGRSEL